MLEHEEEYSKGLKAELEDNRQKHEEQAMRDQAKVQSLTKYV